MARPTLQEINDAISTLASAGLLLNVEQTLAVNRVRTELKLQAEAVARAAEVQRRKEQEARRISEQYARQSEIEWNGDEKSTHENSTQNLAQYDNVQYDGIWEALNNRSLRTAYKKYLYANGMRGSMCTSRMAHLSYKFKEIDEKPDFRTLVIKCRTFAEMHKVLDSFLIIWGDDKRFAWRKQFFHDFLTFVQEHFVQEPNKKKSPKSEKTEVKSDNQKKDTTQISIELKYTNGTKSRIPAYEALIEVINRIGSNKVFRMNIKVGKDKLLRPSLPSDGGNYIKLDRYFWILYQISVNDIFINVLRIIDLDFRQHFKGAKLISSQSNVVQILQSENIVENCETFTEHTLFSQEPKESPRKKRRKVELIFSDGSKQTLDPFEALKEVIIQVGFSKVLKMNVRVGRSKLLRLSAPYGSNNYIQINRYYWLQNRGTTYEIFMNILKIIDMDNRKNIIDASLKLQEDA